MYLQVSKLAKSFGGQEVLRDISFTLGGRERVGLVGKNGSGKSTLFKILVGEETPENGVVAIRPKNARIGYLPQVMEDASPLSSGQRLKNRFRELVETRPDMLLLDEPTNHLDWPGLQWLERSVKSFSGPVLLVSHDRYFLARVIDKIFELEEGKIQIYGGNYSFYKLQKQIQVEANEREYIEQRKRLKKLEDRAAVMKNRTQQLEVATTGTDHYVRRKAAKAARSAIAMEKRMRKELTETRIEKPEPNWELKALFKPYQESGQTVVWLKSISYGGILSDISLTIEKGQRVALVGNNGCGKTTLIKLILGELTPDSGEVRLGGGVAVGYLSQEQQELNSERIVLDELTGENIDQTASYKLLRRFLLPAEKIRQPVKLLSSGEKAKLLLAKIMTSGANFMILDEPTNHLDIPSREAIEEAIANYPGTLLVVSHDRYFLERVRITDTISALAQSRPLSGRI